MHSKCDSNILQYDEGGNIKFDEVTHLLPTEIKEKLEAVSAKCQTIRKYFD